MSDKEYIERLLQGGTYGEEKDPKTGKTYYFNKQTREVTWNLKAAIQELKKLDEQEAARDAANSTSDALPPSAAALKSQASVTFAAAADADPPPTDENPFKKFQRTPPASGNPVPMPKKVAPITAMKEMPPPLTSSPSPSAVPTKAAAPGKSKEELAASALASGTWRQVADYKGDRFFVNEETGDTTGDLGLFLQIQDIVGITTQPSKRSEAIRHAVGEAVPSRPPLVTASSSLRIPDELLGDWMSVVVSGPDQEEAAARLIRFLSERSGEASALATVRAERDEARAQMVSLKKSLQEVGEQKRALAREVEELRAALLYGGDSVSRNYTHPSIDFVDAAPLAHRADKGYKSRLGDAPQFTSYGFTANAPTTVRASLTQQVIANSTEGPATVVDSLDERKRKKPFFESAIPPWRLPQPPQPVTEVTINDLPGTQRGAVVRDERKPTTNKFTNRNPELDEHTAERIDSLEKTVYLLQCHNRQLKQALDESSTAKHLKENCGVCEVLDPWKRLVVGAVGVEGYANNRLPSHLVGLSAKSLDIPPRHHGIDHRHEQFQGLLSGSQPPPSAGSITLIDTWSSGVPLWPTYGVGTRGQHQSITSNRGDALGQALGATLGAGEAMGHHEGHHEGPLDDTHERDVDPMRSPGTHWVRSSGNHHGSLADRGHQYALSAARGVTPTVSFPMSRPDPDPSAYLQRRLL